MVIQPGHCALEVNHGQEFSLNSSGGKEAPGCFLTQTCNCLVLLSLQGTLTPVSCGRAKCGGAPVHFQSRVLVTQALSGSCLLEYGNQGGKVRKTSTGVLWEGLGLSNSLSLSGLP